MEDAMNTPPPVLCFGEILWDFLPDGLFPGGAPFNVAYHLHRLGRPVRVVSAVGRDVLGDELIRRLDTWGIDTGLISRLPALSTGYVRAILDARGDARYDITRDVAWDHIGEGEALLRAAAGAGALVFGSLAQRSAKNRTTLQCIRDALPATALRVFDVNLRAPHDDPALVLELAQRVSLLKLNDAEAARLAGAGPDTKHQPEQHARTLAERCGAVWVCVTCGARGAGLLHEGSWFWAEGRPVDVADTIGAGDSFLASLVSDVLAGDRAPEEIVARACRLGEWVASHRGATPPHPPRA